MKILVQKKKRERKVTNETREVVVHKPNDATLQIAFCLTFASVRFVLLQLLLYFFCRVCVSKCQHFFSSLSCIINISHSVN